MATRTLETRRDRLVTTLVLPLMSCSARFPIYALLIPAFFPKQWRAPVLWILYLIGILLAIGLVKLFRSTLFRGESAPFVMELPPYHRPTVRAAVLHTWERSRLFLRKAGTIIVAISIIMWAMTTYPRIPRERITGFDGQHARSAELSYAIAGRIGHRLEPVMRHVGFDWKTTTALIGAFAAKEVFVSQLGIIHAIGDSAGQRGKLAETLRREYNTLQAFCIMLFCLIGLPCMATFAITWRESGSLKWALFQNASLTFLAYIVTFIVYQTGTLLRLGLS
jgi:ferrous iron transport protein B